MPSANIVGIAAIDVSSHTMQQMSNAKGQTKAIELSAKDFGGFTREHLAATMKTFPGASDIETAIAAAFLAAHEPRGINPGLDAISTALDLLSRTNTPLARELLWQAAANAQNSRIRIEAIRRSGPVADTAERRELLRKWSADGFTLTANFQNDQFSIEFVREAALTALGNLLKPTSNDIDAIIAAMSLPENSREFPRQVFNAAIEAYWNCGTIESFDKVLLILTSAKNWRNDIGLPIVALAAKFSAAQLKKHAEMLRNAMREYAIRWQDEPSLTSRLATLAECVATPQFLIDWASAFGNDGLEQGRGKITKKLLDTAAEPTQQLATALLNLAQWPQNVSVTTSQVLSLLKSVTKAGHSQLVANTIIAQNQRGYNSILESGMFVQVFPSVQTAVRCAAESISSRGEIHEQRRQAEKIAAALLISFAQSIPDDGQRRPTIAALTNRRRHDQQHDSDFLTNFVNQVELLNEQDNPIACATRLVHDSAVGGGAAALLENWLRPEDELSRYTMMMVISEAGRAEITTLQILERIEQFLLKPVYQNAPALRQPLERALLQAAVVDGSVNRYAIDLMDRENLGFEQGVTRALAELSDPTDADFLLTRLAARGGPATRVLTSAINFHRDGNEELTEKVQAGAIARATDVYLNEHNEQDMEAYARQLHQRFQDMPTVREAAYRACGRLSSFVSIKPLRDRQQKETATSPKAAIGEAINLLGHKLAQSKPDAMNPHDIRKWLAHVRDLSDPSLLGLVTGYLRPPHADHDVRRDALRALASMGGQQALDVVKKFIENTAPEGETLAVARNARMKLEQRTDIGVFDILGKYFDAEAEVLDPVLDYEKLVGPPLMMSTVRGLTKATKLWDDGHWDEFITQINGVIEALIRHIFRSRYAKMGLDQQKGGKLAGGNSYAAMLAMTEFRSAFGKLQSHANTIQSFRRDSPTAHAMNKDGTSKSEATSDDAEYVRSEFRPAFSEAVKALN